MGENTGMSTRGVETAKDEPSAIFLALQESEERFRSMADCAPAPVWVTGEAGGLLFVNRAFEELADRPAKDLLGEAWVDLIHREDLPHVATQRAQAWANRSPYTFTARFRRADGDLLWLQCSSNPRFDADGAFLGYVGLAVDLTDIRAAEMALRESEERFRLISESAPVMLWMGDAVGRCLYLNKAQREFWGVTEEDVATFEWGSTLQPDSAAELAEPFAQAMADHTPMVVEADYRRADGERRRLRTQANPRFNGRGEFLGMIGVNVDVTEARQAENDLRRINDLLSERVASALAEKESAEDALFHAQKMEAVGRLTGGVAHDFNNLLTVVIGSIDMALGKLDDPVRTRRLLEAAMEASRRGERLTHQLLSFSRRQALRPSLCDVGRLVTESQPLLLRAVGESVTLDLRLADAECTSWVDPTQLEAALLNLVVNARDATLAGGVIAIEVGRVLLADGEVKGVEAGAYVRLAVSDNGAGMSPDIVERVFEPFFTTKEVGKGTGLGLSQVYGFTAQSGGGLSLKSRTGEGTTVELFLPLSGEAATLPSPAPAPDLDAGKRMRILLAEDDTAVAGVAQEMLLSLGHEVIACPDGQEALRLLHQGEHFDLLVTDLIMPGGVSGLELARKASQRDPELQILLTSGYVGEGETPSGASEAWPLLLKPYSRANMAAALSAFSPRET